MKKQPAKKRTSTKSKTTRVSTKSAKSNVKSWHIIGEWYVALPLAILIVFLAGYLARGWIRYHAGPVAVRWSVDDTQKVLNDQMNNLKDPLVRMGITQKVKSGDCTLTYANGFTSNYFCGHAYQGYLSDVRNLKPSLADRATALEISLQTAGWMRGGTSITQLGSNISKGIDSTPDAAYFKRIGAYTCLLDFSTAFSKPKPPAINGNMACSRSYDILGKTPYHNINP